MEDGGTTWKAQRPSREGPLGAISCPSTAMCSVVGTTTGNAAGAVIATTKGGATWTRQTSRRGARTSSESLARPLGTTTASGGGAGNAGLVIAITNGGSTWTSQPLPTGIAYLTDVSCPTAAECWTAGVTANAAEIITTAPVIRAGMPPSGAATSPGGTNLERLTVAGCGLLAGGLRILATRSFGRSPKESGPQRGPMLPATALICEG